MNIVFIGSSKFGLRCLEHITGLQDVNLVGVVTSKETFTISYSVEGVKNFLYADFPSFCKSKNIPYLILELSMKDSKLLDSVKKWQPDIFIVVGWYHMIPKQWRDLAPAFGLHASLLPKYSGGAPLVWAMINGENETGITLFKMDDGVDSGLILDRAKEPIYDNDNIELLYSRIEEKGINLLERSLPKIINGEATFEVQDESQRRVFPQRTPDDGLIDWNKDFKFIDRFVRAQTKPYPGAYTIFKNNRLIIWKATLNNDLTTGLPGTVFEREGIYHVCCGYGSLILNLIQYKDKEFLSSQMKSLFSSGSIKFDN